MKEKKDNQEIIDSYDYLSNAASTTDCTGLIPTPADTEAERESYEAIYHYEPPKMRKENDQKKEHCKTDD